MSRIILHFGTRRAADNDGAEPPGMPANLLGTVLGLVSARKSNTALAMMSERDLDDLGLLPWEVRAEVRQASKRSENCGMP